MHIPQVAEKLVTPTPGRLRILGACRDREQQQPLAPLQWLHVAQGGKALNRLAPFARIDIDDEKLIAGGLLHEPPPAISLAPDWKRSRDEPLTARRRKRTCYSLKRGELHEPVESGGLRGSGRPVRLSRRGADLQRPDMHDHRHRWQ